jgi:hypothetical protein
METVYNKIVDTFNDHPEVFTLMEVPAVRTIDLHMGQPDDPEDWEIFFPAVFIGWSIAPGATGEADILTMEFHILQEPGAGTEHFSDTVDAGLEYLRVIKACKYILNRMRADNTTPFKWAGERPAITPFFRYHILTYTCSIDAYNDSLNRPAYGEATGKDVNLTSAKVIKTLPKVESDIDTYN